MRKKDKITEIKPSCILSGAALKQSGESPPAFKWFHIFWTPSVCECRVFLCHTKGWAILPKCHIPILACLISQYDEQMKLAFCAWWQWMLDLRARGWVRLSRLPGRWLGTAALWPLGGRVLTAHDTPCVTGSTDECYMFSCQSPITPGNIGSCFWPEKKSPLLNLNVVRFSERSRHVSITAPWLLAQRALASSSVACQWH